MASSEIPDLGTILSVWAHPDDESYCCGGLMAHAIANGNRVVCVTATRGELGTTDEQRWPPGPPLAETRTNELAACLKELGVTEHIWLDYPDGGCAEVSQVEATDRLKKIVEEVRPDTVLTFGPDGGTWHPDHMAVSRWATAAVDGTNAEVLYTSVTPEWMEFMLRFVPAEAVMMTDDPPLVHTADELSVHVRLDEDLLDRKYRAMLCQESQVGPLVAAMGLDNYRLMLAEEAFRPATAGL